MYTELCQGKWANHEIQVDMVTGTDACKLSDQELQLFLFHRTYQLLEDKLSCSTEYFIR